MTYEQPEDNTFYRGYRLHCYPGMFSVWCAVYWQGRRILDREGDDREAAIRRAKNAIDARDFHEWEVTK